MSDFFILYLILWVAAQALVFEIIDLLGVAPKRSSTTAYKLYRTLVFYTAVALGFLYITKLFVILLILNIVHSNAKEEFDNSGTYKYLDYAICCLGFLYQMHWVCQVIK